MNPDTQWEMHPLNRSNGKPYIHMDGWIKFLRTQAEIYEDDVFADFGGSDGAMAEYFRRVTNVRMLVVDALPQCVKACRLRGVSATLASLDNLPFVDGYIDWAFCSHTLEHLDDLDKGLKEIFRVIKRGVFFVVPLETDGECGKNPAHVNNSADKMWWVNKLRAAGFRVIDKHIWKHPDSSIELTLLCQKLTGPTK